MATLYWVGGTGTWDHLDKTHWATSSGGAGGAAIPTPLDDVVFDANSDAGAIFTVTCNGPSECQNFSTSSLQFTMTFAGTGTLAVYGSMTLPATLFTRTYLGIITFASTTTGNTITLNGVTFASAITFNGTGGGWTLGSALTTTSNINFNAGDFSSGNFAITANLIFSTTMLPRTISLGSSTANFSGITFSDTVTSNLTFNAGTSSIIMVGASSYLNAPNATFYNVSQTSTSSNTFTITGNITFNDLLFTSPATAGVRTIRLAGNQTINGTLTMAGATVIRRIALKTNIGNVQRTIKIAAKNATANVDFKGILVDPTGVIASISGTSIGDCGNNTNITADTPKTVYWNLTGTQLWSATAWATTSGGTPALANFPLPQDTAIFNNTGAATNVTINATWNIGGLNASARTTAVTLASTATAAVHKDFILGSGVTTSSLVITIEGNTAQSINTLGKTVGISEVNKGAGDASLANSFVTASAFVLTAGSFNTNGFTVDMTSFSCTGDNVCSLSLGATSGNFSSNFNVTNTTNFTFNAGTSSVVFNIGSVTISAAGLSFYKLQFSAPASAAASRIINLSSDLTVTNLFTVGSAVTQNRRVRIKPTTLGTITTISAATVSLANVDFQQITASGAAAAPNWTGTSLGDAGFNSNITFTAAKTVYWNLTGAQNWSATAWATVSGGTPSAANFPLPQDTCIFDNIGAATTVTFDIAYIVGTVNLSARTVAVSLVITGALTIVGDWTNGSGVTISGTGGVTYATTGGTQTITSAGKTWTGPQTINASTGTVLLADAFTAGLFILASGTFDANGFNVTLFGVTLSGSVPRTLNMGSGLWTLTGNSGFLWVTSGTNLTINRGTADIILTFGAILTTAFFGGGGYTYNKLTIATGTIVGYIGITGSNTFTELASTMTSAYSLRFAGGTTNTFDTFTVTGSAGNLVSVASTDTSQATLFKNSSWIVGANSIDNWDNTNLSFTAGGSIDYLVFSYIIGVASAISDAIGETTTLTEVLTAIITASVDVNESATLSDTQAVLLNAIGTISESETLTESQSSLANYATAISETETLTDAQAGLAIYPSTIAESETLTDAQAGLAIFPRNVSETVTLSETQTGGFLFASTIIETETLTETQSAIFNLVGAISETETLTNIQTGLAIYPNSISETETLTNTQTALAIYPSTISETETLTDTQTGLAIYPSAITETETLTDVQTGQRSIPFDITETTTLSEVQTGTFNFLSSVTELQVITDTQTGLAIYRSAIAENQIITDTQLGNMIYPSVLNETQTLTDIYTGQRSLYYAVTETTTLTNTQSATYLFAGNIVEAVDLTTTQNAQAIINSTQNELMLITDSSFGRGWFKVADGQTPDWQNINDAQGTGWVNINDSNDAGWIPVDDKQ